MQRTLLSLAIAALAGTCAIAEESALTPEQAARKEQLNTEIEKLTEELDTLKAIEDEQAEPQLWTGDLELGYVDTHGNTIERNFKSKADITRERDAWRFTVFYDSLNSESEGVRTAEKYFYSNRLAYAYSEYNYTYAYASYDDDRFSGFDYQATASAGYGRRIYNLETLKWDAEIGPGYRYSEYADDPLINNTEELILRAFTDFRWEFTDNATFSQSLSVEDGDDNTISKSITALKAQIIGSFFAVKLTYTVKYSEEVPEDTKHADKETAVTLTYTF